MCQQLYCLALPFVWHLPAHFHRLVIAVVHVGSKHELQPVVLRGQHHLVAVAHAILLAENSEVLAFPAHGSRLVVPVVT